jgi:hypothetical protein
MHNSDPTPRGVDNRNILLSFKNGSKLGRKHPWKVLYKDFKPHITLYNGTDEVFAKKLFERLQQNFKSFDFKVERRQYFVHNQRN